MIVSFLRPLIDSQSQISIKTSACLHFPFSSGALQFPRALRGRFAPTQSSPRHEPAAVHRAWLELPVCPDANSQGGAGGHGMPVERGPIKISHRQKYAKSTPKAASVAVSSPRRVRKLRMASIIGISSTPFRSTHHATVGAIL